MSDGQDFRWIMRSHRVDANTVEMQLGQYGIDIMVLSVDMFRPAKEVGIHIFSESCIDKYRIGIATALSEVMCADVLQLVARCLPSFEYELPNPPKLNMSHTAVPEDRPVEHPPSS